MVFLHAVACETNKRKICSRSPLILLDRKARLAIGYLGFTSEEAVALIQDQRHSVSVAAKSLGVETSLLCKWKEKIEAQHADKAISEDERSELKRLRQENKALGMEKEIFKKRVHFSQRK